MSDEHPSDVGVYLVNVCQVPTGTSWAEWTMGRAVPGLVEALLWTLSWA